jgi:hypothetical protein
MLLLPACVTMRDCQIETLQPAKLTFEGPRKNIALCASKSLFSEAIIFNEVVSSISADSLIANILYSLQHLWEESLGYEDTQFFVYITETGEIPNASAFDLVVQLEKLQIKNKYYGQQYGYFDWEAYLHVQYAAKWLVRSQSGMLLDEYTDRDLIMWSSGFYQSRLDAVMNLPDIKDAWWDMGIVLAQNHVNRIVPQWQAEIRNIYMINKFPELSQRAYIAMQNNGYGRAFDIWENMLMSCRKRGQKKIKSQITCNMAVACEFQNQLEEAVYWTQQSINYSKKTRTINYLKLLRERQQQRIQLDQQTVQELNNL